MRNLVIKKPELLEESIENLYAFLETLALTDFQNQRKNFWPHLRNLIADLNIFQNVSTRPFSGFLKIREWIT